MAKSKEKSKQDNKIEDVTMPNETELENVSETKVKFLVWFSDALSKFAGLKAHHMSAVRTYFVTDLRIGEIQSPEVFDDGLIKFGFRRI